MAKTKKKRVIDFGKIKKRKNPQDATLRNVRSANAKINRLNGVIEGLERQLVPALRALERRISALERTTSHLPE